MGSPQVLHTATWLYLIFNMFAEDVKLLINFPFEYTEILKALSTFVLIGQV